MAYAERTSVQVDKSKADIEKIVRKYGADSFAIMHKGRSVKVAFDMKGRNVLFSVEVPEGAQKERSMWRALFLVIKAKCESAESKIETFEEAFLANIMMPDGKTVSQAIKPTIARHYDGDLNVPLLPNY